MKAIVIGATSGIGRELAKQMSQMGYVVGITGRRTSLLDSLEREIPNACFKETIDLTNISDTTKRFNALLEKMDSVDVVIINSGTGSIDPKFPLSDELETVAVNVAGFTVIANLSFHYFSKKNKGHIVAVSSVAAARGGPISSYNASKAYISSYMEGLSCRSHLNGNKISVTDIRPGFVDTDMARGEGVFWKCSVEIAAKQILEAIIEKRRLAYVTKRWRLIWVLLSLLPFSLYRRLLS